MRSAVRPPLCSPPFPALRRVRVPPARRLAGWQAMVVGGVGVGVVELVEEGTECEKSSPFLFFPVGAASLGSVGALYKI